MPGGDILIVKGSDLLSLLAGKESEIINKVRTAYEAHGQGACFRVDLNDNIA